MIHAEQRPGIALRFTFVPLLLATVQVAAQDSTSIRELESRRRGDVQIVVRNRAFVIPERVQAGLTIQPTVGLTWMATDALRLGVDAQTVDNSGPGQQGPFRASRTVPGGGSGNFLQEITLEAALRFLQDEAKTYSLSLSGSLSRSRRSYFAYDSSSGRSFSGNRREIVPTLAMDAEYRTPRAGGVISLVAAFLPDDNALYVRALPDERRRFGTVLGAQLAADVQVAGPLTLWGRGFAPITGHNTIDRDTGRPVRAVPFDAGFRLRLNPALDVELFASNALGNSGALAFIPDREYRALGAGVSMRPGARFVSEEPLADERYDPDDEVAPTSLALASLAPTTMTRGQFTARVRAGGQGIFGSVELAPVRALQLGAFIDFLRGTRDEGELGATARVNLIEESAATPLRIGAVVAASRTNNPLVNLLAGRWDELERLGLPKGGFNFGDENEREGRVYVVTGALAFEKRLTVHSAARLAPVIGYVQRHGVQLTGVAAGFERTLTPALSLALESGFVTGKGNMLTSRGRERAVPYGVTLAWRPGMGSRTNSFAPVTLDAYVTNRAGDSPFHMLRVRAGGGITGGIGMRLATP